MEPCHDYKRNGTTTLFAALWRYCREGWSATAARHFTKPTPNRSSQQFVDYLVEIVASYPEADTIHLVMDIHDPKTAVELPKRLRAIDWERVGVERRRSPDG